MGRHVVDSSKPPADAMAEKYGPWIVAQGLGGGGQAQTYVVTHESDPETKRVLKRLRNLRRRDRFSQEAQNLKLLDHENVLKLFDVDVVSDKPYIVTEYCVGGSLDDLAVPFWSNDPGLTIELFIQICRGVEYAHSKNIIHRDIKPGNIFMRSDIGPMVVGDFGLSILTDNLDGRVTRVDEAVGPRLFMAPELEDGRAEPNSASDVYSLGKLLFWMLTGRVFSREKHRQQNWDAKGYNLDSMTGWSNVYLEHVNRVLDKMIVEDPERRGPLVQIHAMLKASIRLVNREFNPVVVGLAQPCTYCGQGVYKMAANSSSGSHQVSNFGFSAVGASDWRIFACRTCGHVQSFRVDLAERKDWWAPPPS